MGGVDEQERPVLRRELKRANVESFFAKQDATEVVLEACGGSHHWGRLLNKLGHRVRLIPPQYVKPFVKRAKNDRNDAEAISEAASRPCMRSVVVKTVDQQADGTSIGCDARLRSGDALPDPDFPAFRVSWRSAIPFDQPSACYPSCYPRSIIEPFSICLNC
jgi:transposase